MDKQFKDFLLEGRDAPLYHSTNPVAAVNILIANIIMTSRDFKNVSLTRDLNFAKKWAPDAIIFELVQRKLSQRYKIVPHDYWSSGDGQADIGMGMVGNSPFRRRVGEYNEAEEVIIKAIKPLDKYLKQIWLPKKLFDVDPEKLTTPFRSLNNIIVKNNIPYKIY